MAGLVTKIQNKLTQRKVKANGVMIPRGDKSSHKPLMRMQPKPSTAGDKAARSNSNDSCSSTNSENVTNSGNNPRNDGISPRNSGIPPRPTTPSRSQMKFTFSNRLSPITKTARSLSQSMTNLMNLGSHVMSTKSNSTTSEELDSEVFEIPFDSECSMMNNLSLGNSRTQAHENVFHTDTSDAYSGNIYDVNSSNVTNADGKVKGSSGRAKPPVATRVSAKNSTESLNNNKNQRNLNITNAKAPSLNTKNKACDAVVTSVLSDWSSKPVESWSNDDLINWVVDIGMEQLKEPIKGSGLRGMHLSDLTEDSLVSLGLTETMAQHKFVAELAGVLSRPLSLWSLQQASIKRRNLEKSTDQLFANLETLQKLNEEQEQLICTSMKELKLEQEVAEELLRRDVTDVDSEIENLANEAELYSKQMSKNIYTWTTDDVVRWLRMNALTDFILPFTVNGINGEDIMDENLKCLDNLEPFATDQKEILYSAVYRLLNPAPLETTVGDLRKIENDGDKQKYFAAIHVAKSQAPDDFLRSCVYTPAVSGEMMSSGSVGGEKDVNTARTTGDVSPIYADVIDYITPVAPPRMNLPPRRPASAFPYSQSSSHIRNSAPSLYSQIGREQDYCILCMCVAIKNNRLNFDIHIPEKGHVIVVSTNNKLRLQKDDRILEVCGQLVHDISLPEVFYDIFKDKKLLQLVILRNRDKQISDKDELRVLQNKMDISEQHWESLRRMLREMRDDDSTPVMQLSPVIQPSEDINQLRQEKDQLEEALSNNLDKVSNLQQALEQKNHAIRVGSDQKRMLERRLEKFMALMCPQSTLNDRSVSDLEGKNTWTTVQSANRVELLRTLRETIAESCQQRSYLDKLIAVVVDKSPWVLQELDDQVSRKSIIRRIGEEWC